MAAPKLGKLTKESDGYRVVFDRTLNHPSSTVWKAITDPKIMSIWFMKTEIDFKVGGKITFHFGDPANTLSYGKIVRIEPETIFEWLWLNDDGPDELAIWELTPLGKNQTRLVLNYSRLSEKYKSMASGGWHIILDRLEEVLAGRQEPYPYTGGESVEEKAMVEKYAALLK